MNKEEIKIKAFIVDESNRIPISAKHASKYSLLIKYSDNQSFKSMDRPVNLLIQDNGQSVELGPCRVLPYHGSNGYAGRLVFTQDIYDLERFFSTSKITKLQAPFDDLSLLLSRKDTIEPAFAEYTANLTYDLNVYKSLFDNLDLEYRDEPENVKESIQRAIIETEEDKFRRFLDDKQDGLERIVADFNIEEHQHHGYYFRKQLWSFLTCCPALAHTNLKPRGYAGDSEMMRILYLNDYQGESTFSKLMHKHSVEHAASQSVRNRLELITGLLGRVHCDVESCSQEKLEVLSVGCGPAFELENILRSPQDCQKYHFTLLDQDPSALCEASDLIKEIETKTGVQIEVDYVNISVRTMLFSRQLKQKLGRFHFIYSMGLFDYLAEPVAKAVLNKLYELLRPRGEMVVGNFHVSNSSKCYMEYWCDWILYHRTEKEFRDLLEDNSSADISVLFEDTRSQMFLHLIKQEDSL